MIRLTSYYDDVIPNADYFARKVNLKIEFLFCSVPIHKSQLYNLMLKEYWLKKYTDIRVTNRQD